MSVRPTLTEHLILCLDTLCGRWNREGERVNAPSVLMPAFPRPAQAFAPPMLPPEMNPAANTERTRLRNLRQINLEMPTSALADEILEPGEGQVRALIVTGGNPLAACADPVRLARALESLELLVCVDIALTPTCRRAHYVLAAKHMLQRADVAAYQDMLYERPFAQYTDALIASDGDLLEDWYVFAALAERLGAPSFNCPGRARPRAPPDDARRARIAVRAREGTDRRDRGLRGRARIRRDSTCRCAHRSRASRGRLCLAPDGRGRRAARAARRAGSGAGAPRARWPLHAPARLAAHEARQQFDLPRLAAQRGTPTIPRS
jgi:anaerobic selenocysteine-containing dehydrogenase